MSTQGVGPGGGMDVPDLSQYIQTDAAKTGDTSQTTQVQQPKGQQAVQDSIQTQESEMGQQVESYQAPANRPTLDPTVTVPAPPAQKGAPANAEEAQQEEFMKMVSDLPPDLRSQLLKDMGKPEGQRDPELQALESTLNAQAQETVWAKGINAGAPVSDEELAALLQEGGDNAEVLQKLLGKPTLTKAESDALKQLVASGKNLTPEQKAQINAKLQQTGGDAAAPLQQPNAKETSRYGGQQEGVSEGAVAPGGTPGQAVGPGGIPGQIDPATGLSEAQIASMGLSKLDPANMTPEQLQMATRQNGIAMLENQTQIIKATMNALPPDDPMQPVLNDFLKFIGGIIAECKKFLAKLSTMDAEQGKKAAVGLRETQQAKLEKQMEQIKKAAEMKKKADTLSTVMKIAGPIIAVAMVALVIVSGGSAIAIAVAVMLLVVAIIASTTTIIDDAMKEVTDQMIDVFKSMGMSEEMAQIMTMIVMIIVIIALVVVTRGACTQGTGMVAGQIGKEAAKQATTRVANAMALQVAATAVTHSNCIALGMKPLLMSMGMDEETAEIVAMVIQMIALMTLMIGSAGSLASAGQAVAKSAAGTMGQTATTVAKALEALATAVQAATQGYSAVSNLRMAGMAKEKAELEKVIAELETQQDSDKVTKDQRQKGIDGMSDLATFYSQSFDRILQSHQKILRDATSV